MRDIPNIVLYLDIPSIFCLFILVYLRNWRCACVKGGSHIRQCRDEYLCQRYGNIILFT